VLKEAFGSPRPDLFGIIGGPPCPDFSSGGTHAGGNGINGKLTTTFVDMICSIKPPFFVIENVPGLYRFPQASRVPGEEDSPVTGEWLRLGLQDFERA
jgi:site-specific DNA-cytosine methylase